MPKKIDEMTIRPSKSHLSNNPKFYPMLLMPFVSLSKQQKRKEKN